MKNFRIHYWISFPSSSDFSIFLVQESSFHLTVLSSFVEMTVIENVHHQVLQ
jgi:hypothetical protein